MSVGITSNNTTIKVKGKVSATYTVAAGEYVIATYTFQTSTGSIQPVVGLPVYYAPGDSVASTLAIGGGTGAVTLTLVTALCFTNSP